VSKNYYTTVSFSFGYKGLPLSSAEEIFFSRLVEFKKLFTLEWLPVLISSVFLEEIKLLEVTMFYSLLKAVLKSSAF
jgi:hypothetical protein